MFPSLPALAYPAAAPATPYCAALLKSPDATPAAIPIVAPASPPKDFNAVIPSFLNGPPFLVNLLPPALNPPLTPGLANVCFAPPV